jgi:hypothetical protein
MKRFVIAALAVGFIAALSVGLTSHSNAAPKDPFIGAWESIDVDGSHQRVSIGGGGAGIYHLAYFDDYATLCGGGQATAIGSGSADGYDLHAEVLVRCLSQHFILGSSQFMFTYDPATDTLESWVTWYRIGR